MSQVFSADSVNAAGAVTVTGTTESPVVMGNFLNPPFGNAKVHVAAMFALTAGSGTTFVTVNVRRNPAGENLVIATANAIVVSAGVTQLFAIQVADVIPDGRAVRYQVTVQQTGATGNGSAVFANIAAFLISG